MTSVEETLVAALLADAAVSALVSDRVFVTGGRQGATRPYVTVQRITTKTNASLDASSTLDAALTQIDSWADTALAARGLAEAVRAAIDCRDIETQDPWFNAVLQDDRGPTTDEETRAFRVSQDYDLWHSRS